VAVAPLLERFDQASGRLAGALLEHGGTSVLDGACLDGEARSMLQDATLAPAAQLATLLHARLGLDWSMRAFSSASA
jgi:proteasome assembly chaperone (PAC2) family protein